MKSIGENRWRVKIEHGIRREKNEGEIVTKVFFHS